jgi:chemotaxis protein MotD
MTAAIGQRFSQVSAAPRAGGTTGVRGSEHDGETAFGDLVHGDGKRGARAAPLRSAEAKTAPGTTGRDPDPAVAGDPKPTPPRTEGHPAKSTRHSHRAAPTGDRARDERRPEAADAGDAQPLRDRLPLLATLNKLGQHDAASVTRATDRKAAGMSQAANTALARPVERNGPAAAKADGRPDVRRPDEPNPQIAPHVPLAETVAAAGNGAHSPKIVASVASPPRAHGRQTESGAPPTGAPPRPPASGNAADRLTGILQAAPTQAGPTDGAEGGPARDGQEDGAASAKAGRWASHRDGSAREPDRVSGNGAERHPSASVNVVAERSFPAPAAHPPSRTTAGVIDALSAMGTQAPASALSPPPHPVTVAHSIHVLRIELHPAELGMVTASLRMSGEQLSIELKPETAEAYRHLSRDSDTIVKSLRKLGLDVDGVTVMQPSIAAQPTVRVDAGNQSSFMPGRDAGQFQPGTPGGGGDSSGGHHSGRNRSHDGRPLDSPTPAHRERGRGSLFI